MTESPSPRLRGQVVRYLIVGGTNTLITYAIFIGLGLIIPPPIAYSIAFAAGLVWAVVGSAKFVFKTSRRAWTLLVFCAWYLLVFGLGQLIIHLLAPKGFVALALTSLAVLLVTTPLTFIGGRYIFTDRTASAPIDERE